MIRGHKAILVLLTGLNLLNYLDRYVLAAVLPGMKGELGLSFAVSGSLATVFLVGYFATSPLFGTWADCARPGGRKKLIAAGVTVWSLATLATGLVRETASLVAARALVGVGEASYATIAPTIIDDVAPAEGKARWMAIFYSAIPVGSALGYIVGGTVEGATHSWRNAFFVAGGPGIALALLVLFIAEPSRSSLRRRSNVLGSARELLRRAPYRVGVLGYCAYTFGIGGFAYWAPTYLALRYGMAAGAASRIFGGVTVLGGAIGTFLGGWMSDALARARLRRAGPLEEEDAARTRASLAVCALSTGLGAPLAALAILAPTAKGFFWAVLPCEMALFLCSSPINVALLRSVPLGLRASAMALSIFAIHMLGDLWSPWLMGAAADRFPMHWTMLLCPAAFACSAVVWMQHPKWIRGASALPHDA